MCLQGVNSRFYKILCGIVNHKRWASNGLQNILKQVLEECGNDKVLGRNEDFQVSKDLSRRVNFK